MKKINKLQVFRFLVQIAFFIIYPGLITLVFAGLQQIYTSLLSGRFNLVQLLPQLTEVIIIIPLTIIMGRFFCGWFCAFGAFNDLMYKISPKIFKRKFKINERLDSILKLLKYFILVFIIWFMWTSKNNFFAAASPWDAFGQINDIKYAFSTYAPGFILLILIGIGGMFIERFFCRYLCPLGAVFSIVSLLRGFKIKKPNDQCGNCRLCTMKCSMGIKLYSMSKVNSGECINCMKCVGVCPRKNIYPSIYGEKCNPALASAVAITAFTGLYTIGTNSIVDTFDQPKMVVSIGTESSLNDNSRNSNINNVENTTLQSKANSSKVKQKSKQLIKNNKAKTYGIKINNVPNIDTKNTASPVANSPKHLYNDGTYTGTGTGFRPGTQVEVNILNGKITNIQILSSNDTLRFRNRAYGVVPQEIIQAQSTKVDVVSGATRSSNGVLMAVADALSKAKAK